MAHPGGLKQTQPITDEARNVALSVKGKIEEKSGATFNTFNPVEFATQVVAGTNFFVKIDVGGGHFVHARIYRDLHNNISLHSIQSGKAATDPIVYF